MSTQSAEKPQTPLGALVMAGQGQTEAEAITNSIFMVKDISNAYLVTTGDGDLLVNTGTKARVDKESVVIPPFSPSR